MATNTSSSDYIKEQKEKAAEITLLPFPGKLKFDTELKLSNNDFKQTIERSVEELFNPNDNKLENIWPYPTPYVSVESSIIPTQGWVEIISKCVAIIDNSRSNNDHYL
jgi:hypothetical protein